MFYAIFIGEGLNNFFYFKEHHEKPASFLELFVISLCKVGLLKISRFS